ncbi:MAG: 30S ribosomal protein S6e [Crenarchaeota archaeon]|nr:30S ribosomal protein S6e [Thermoproteota archaeon]
MPEFKIVVADPRARNPIAVPVLVVADESLEYEDKHKEQRELPKIKMHPVIIDRIKPEIGIVVVRVFKEGGEGSKEKAKIVGKVVADSSIDVQEVRVPAGFMMEKVGKDRALGEVLRAPAFQIRVGGDKAMKLVGLRIGDVIDASIVGLPGKKLEIRGGSDLAGFPMRPDIPGPVKKYVLLSSGPGFRPREKGERRRKLVRGNTISEDIVQINTILVY